MSATWYVVQSDFKRHAQAVLYLREKGYRVFYPRFRAALRRGAFGRQGLVEEPLFGSYLFVQADLTEGRHWQAVTHTHGVSRILGGGSPKPVPAGVIDILMSLGEDGVIDHDQAVDGLMRYAVDQEVLVTDGSMKGFHGRVKWTRGKRIALFLTIFGRESVVQLRHGQVAPLEASDPATTVGRGKTPLHSMSGGVAKIRNSKERADYYYDKAVRGRRAVA